MNGLFAAKGQKQSPSEKRFSEGSITTCFFAAGVNFLLIFFFLHIGLYLMAYLKVLSIGIFLFAIFFFRKQKIIFPSILVYLEVNVHQALGVYFLGWQAGFQYYLLTLAIYSFFYPYRKIGSFMSFLTITNFFILSILFVGKSPQFFVSQNIITMLHISIGISSMVLIFIASYGLRQAVDTAEEKMQIQFNRAEDLLHNILPVPIATRLKRGEKTIADHFPSVSIFFADIVEFTPKSEKLPPEEIVTFLNSLFSMFDFLTEKYGLEKIKTIGDSYMVAAGIPEQKENHAELIADFALEVISNLDEYNMTNNQDIKLRIGINTGSVVAGVIGFKKYIYDIWGDCVNTASRMESSGLPGKIQTTQNTYDLLKDKYEFERRDETFIKGKGRVVTYFLKGKPVIFHNVMERALPPHQESQK